MTPLSLEDIRDVHRLLRTLVTSTATELGSNNQLDIRQLDAYTLAHAASALLAVEAMATYGEHGELEHNRAIYYGVTTIREVAGALISAGTIDLATLAPMLAPLSTYDESITAPEIARDPGPLHLDSDLELVRSTFQRFAEVEIAPLADRIHRENLDVPETLIQGLGALGAFGLSIPEEYGGFASNGENDFTPMIIATEELSRASLGVGGSLITRPEILARALLGGGTEEQKHRYLPPLAAGKVMAAVAVTEPDFGSDVAQLTTTAVAAPGGYLLNGTKTWCTFAGRADLLMVLARTDPNRDLGHRGLSLFIVDKERFSGESFRQTQNDGGVLEGRAIDTIGYRGMHSFEVSFSNWWVPSNCLVGEESGLGRGFYLQMAGFGNGRIQTAARAIGVMQAAYDAACTYAQSRRIFGAQLIDYPLTAIKLARMATTIQAGRQLSYQVGRLMAIGIGSLEASMTKAFVCKAAERVAREAMQLHGGMGYAEEYSVSRYFVDARVLSIFEGADETLALRVIARALGKAS
ncbi:MAG: acyl-CoA dehydrogenase family protein [Ferrimicrobium sp.]